MTVKRPGPSDIHSELRGRICLLQYPPGCILREADLANEFGVSRTPVREALQRLALEGLVEVRNGVGTIVTKLDDVELRDVYKARIELAPILADIGLRTPDASEIALIETLVERTRLLKQNFDVTEYWEINHQLHHAINALIENETIRTFWDSLYFRAARAWYDLARELNDAAADLLYRELSEILLAMRSGDMRSLAYVKRNYISYSFEYLSSRIR